MLKNIESPLDGVETKHCSNKSFNNRKVKIKSYLKLKEKKSKSYKLQMLCKLILFKVILEKSVKHLKPQSTKHVFIIKGNRLLIIN